MRGREAGDVIIQARIHHDLGEKIEENGVPIVRGFMVFVKGTNYDSVTNYDRGQGFGFAE
jgi:hypothetical protein